ncbi:hypothetical protein L226DRAFT_533953 [Lentinus tigrinus ALCF2SS1-7]|uniref:Uncharacterized protein n=1 Tax=Lentinus tigrinus ALCF2SS1-6 TaxID=1328759 RepID=A0A5C2SBW1_9APHY|nr:hypothetical protein L227DRAFT_575232 [Lentinus tigrinus ALCF2SS1-6]RPD75891.1 hypothetical protein L226DRAFT_533953 [Lentinus tigrinus ALCF2SS1-7]
MDLSPSHSSGTVSKVEGHVPSVVDAHAPLVGDEVEEFKPNVLVIGRIARNDFDEKDEDARTCSLDVAAESEDDLPVSDDTHHSPVEDVPLVYIGAQDCEPVAKFVERIASVDILDDEEDELAADLPTLSGGEDELVAEPPLAFEGDDDNASFGVLYEDEDELVAPLLAFEDDHDHDDVPAPLATSMSLGALDLVSRDTRPLALDLDCDFDTPHATPGLPKTAAAPQPARDVLSGFQQIPGWRWPDRVPSLLLSVEGATSARGDDGTVSSTPAQYAWAAPPAIYTFPRPPIRFPGPHRHPLPPTPPLPASSDVSAVPAASTASEVSAAPPVPAAPAVSAAPVVSARPAAPAEPRAKKSRPRKRQKKKAAKGKAVVEEPPANATTAEPAVTSAGPAPTAEPEAADAPPLGVFSGVLPFAVEKFKVRGPRTPTAERRRRQKARAAAAEERDRVFRLAAIGELGENYQL